MFGCLHIERAAVARLGWVQAGRGSSSMQMYSFNLISYFKSVLDRLVKMAASSRTSHCPASLPDNVLLCALVMG